jgi:hypothetical protein
MFQIVFPPDISISFLTIMHLFYLEPGLFPYLPTFPDEDEDAEKALAGAEFLGAAFFRGIYRNDDQSPYNYIVEVRAEDACWNGSTGTMKMSYTVTRHPDSACMNWKGIETYSISQDQSYTGEGVRYLLAGTGELTAGNDLCRDVRRILGVTAQATLIRKTGCLECTFPADSTSMTLTAVLIQNRNLGREAIPGSDGQCGPTAEEDETAQQESKGLPSSVGGLLTRAEEVNALKSCDIIQWP